MSDFAGSLISGGLGLLSGMLGYNSQKRANRLMAEQYERNLAFSKYQYQDSKRYNSLSNQVNMMRAAGINPALALGSGVSSSSASPVGAPSPSSQEGFDFSGSLNAALSNPFGSQERLNNSVVGANESSSRKNDVEAIGQDIDNMWKNTRNLSEIYHLDVDSWYKEKLSDQFKLQNEFLLRTMNDRVRQESLHTKILTAEEQAASLNASFLPLQQQEQLNNLMANTALAYRSGVATLKQAHAAIMSASAAQMQAEEQRTQNKALYGFTDEERKEYSKAVYNYLLQQSSESESREFSNQFQHHQQSGSVSGMTFSGSYSWNTPVWHRSDYQDFKSTKGHTHRRR